jgi:hypothetical protein
MQRWKLGLFLRHVGIKMRFEREFIVSKQALMPSTVEIKI